MKKTNRIIALVLSLVLCMSCAITAYADSDVATAGKYGSVRGTLTYSGSAFTAVTRVSQNDGTGKLYTTLALYSASSVHLGTKTNSSSYGSVSLTTNYAGGSIYGETLNYAQCCHEVRNASGGYACYTLEYVN